MSESNYVNNLFKTMVHIAVFKCMFPYIALFFIFLMILLGIQRCNTEQDNERACKVTAEYAISQLRLPYYFTKTFTYSEINYNEKDCRYLIYGTLEVKYANGEVDTKNFYSIVEAHGNDEGDFKVVRFEFIEKPKE